MSSDSPLHISRSLLAAMGTRMFVYHEDRIPADSAVVVVSNHRGFMDAPLLMAALGHPIRIACHHYMGQVPMMREIVTQLGCFPLQEPEYRQQAFFEQATGLLKAHQWVGLFPEGGHPMVIHRRVVVLVGHPYWITPKRREQYQGKQAKIAVTQLVTSCRDEISK